MHLGENGFLLPVQYHDNEAWKGQISWWDNCNQVTRFIIADQHYSMSSHPSPRQSSDLRSSCTRWINPSRVNQSACVLVMLLCISAFGARQNMRSCHCWTNSPVRPISMCFWVLTKLQSLVKFTCMIHFKAVALWRRLFPQDVATA